MLILVTLVLVIAARGLSAHFCVNVCCLLLYYYYYYYYVLIYCVFGFISARGIGEKKSTL